MRLKKGNKYWKRFWSKVKKGPDCWQWVGATADGYGKLRVEGKNVSAHRLAWEWGYGPIPKGLLLGLMMDGL